MYQVAVLTPIYKSAISNDEQISLSSYKKHLSNYDHFAIIPSKLFGKSISQFRADKIVKFPDFYFKNIYGYNKLLLSKELYSAFSAYKYILIAQLDAIVFKDELESWCSKEFDYIGAPWSERYRTDRGTKFELVGNGGFSLRNVQSALRVLSQKVSPYNDYSIGYPPRWWYWKRVRRVMLFLGSIRKCLPNISIEKFLNIHFNANEDIFWGVHAKQFDPLFKVAGVDDALRFAFESNPRSSFEKIGKRLPFGCHAWAKYDRKFFGEMGLLNSLE